MVGEGLVDAPGEHAEFVVRAVEVGKEVVVVEGVAIPMANPGFGGEVERDLFTIQEGLRCGPGLGAGERAKRIDHVGEQRTVGRAADVALEEDPVGEVEVGRDLALVEELGVGEVAVDEGLVGGLEVEVEAVEFAVHIDIGVTNAGGGEARLSEDLVGRPLAHVGWVLDAVVEGELLGAEECLRSVILSEVDLEASLAVEVAVAADGALEADARRAGEDHLAGGQRNGNLCGGIGTAVGVEQRERGGREGDLDEEGVEGIIEGRVICVVGKVCCSLRWDVGRELSESVGDAAGGCACGDDAEAEDVDGLEPVVRETDDLAGAGDGEGHRRRSLGQDEAPQGGDDLAVEEAGVEIDGAVGDAPVREVLVAVGEVEELDPLHAAAGDLVDDDVGRRERGVFDRGIDDGGVFDGRIFDRGVGAAVGVLDRGVGAAVGVLDRGIVDRGIVDRGIVDRGVGTAICIVDGRVREGGVFDGRVGHGRVFGAGVGADRTGVDGAGVGTAARIEELERGATTGRAVVTAAEEEECGKGKGKEAGRLAHRSPRLRVGIRLKTAHRAYTCEHLNTFVRRSPQIGRWGSRAASERRAAKHDRGGAGQNRSKTLTRGGGVIHKPRPILPDFASGLRRIITGSRHGRGCNLSQQWSPVLGRAP